MGTHPIFESDFDCLTESAAHVGRRRAGIVRRKEKRIKIALVDANDEDDEKGDEAQIGDDQPLANQKHALGQEEKRRHLADSWAPPFFVFFINKSIFTRIQQTHTCCDNKQNQYCTVTRGCFYFPVSSKHFYILFFAFSPPQFVLRLFYSVILPNLNKTPF